MKVAWIVLAMTLIACNKPPASADDSSATAAHTASAADIAACTGFDGVWRCKQPKPQTFAAPATTPITPASWSVTDWYVDAANSSGTAADSNNCTSAGTPCASWAEISVHRLGPSPIWQSGSVPTLTLHFLSTDSEVVDIVGESQGTVVLVQCALPTALATGTLSSVTTANRSTPTLTKATLAGGLAGNELIVTATPTSRAWLYANQGGNAWSFTQPMAPVTPSAPTSAPAEVNNWTSSTTYSVYAPVKVRLGLVNVVATGFNGGLNNPFVVNSCDISASTADQPLELRASWYAFSESLVEQVISFAVAADTLNSSVVNSVVTANGLYNGHTGSTRTTYFNGGAMEVANVLVNATFDGDVIIDASVTGVTYGYAGQYGTVYIDTSKQLTLEGSGNFAFSTTYSATPIVWGPGTLAVTSNVRLLYPSGASKAAGAFLQSGGFTANGSTAVWLETAAGGITTGKTLSAAHLDTDLGATVGCYQRPGGAAICNDAL